MISVARFLEKIERHVSRIEGCMRLFARASAMNASNSRRLAEGKLIHYDDTDFLRAMEEEVPRRML